MLFFYFVSPSKEVKGLVVVAFNCVSLILIRSLDYRDTRFAKSSCVAHWPFDLYCFSRRQPSLRLAFDRLELELPAFVDQVLNLREIKGRHNLFPIFFRLFISMKLNFFCHFFSIEFLNRPLDARRCRSRKFNI